MFRRLTPVSLVTALALVPMFWGQARAADTKLTVMVFQGLQNLGLLAAQSQGFFAKHGLEVEVKITPSSEVMRQGLAAGQWQIIHTAVDNAVAMADVAKVGISVVAGGDDSFNHLIVQPDIKALSDLKGQTVIVDAPDTAYAFQLYEILKRNGLNKGDYNVKVVGASHKRLAELETVKDSKASMLNPPSSLQAIGEGMKDMGTATKILGPYQGSAIIVLKSWGKEHPEILREYLQAYISGLRWALDAKNKDAAIRLLAEGLKLSPEVAAATYAVAADPVGGLAKDAKFDMVGFKNVLKLRADWTGAQPDAPEKYLDLSYYEKALAGF
jgi:ABC-type nitrate/sulfonate/bicarbonate transport system substrate-binding protein